jgi:CheY-like chemotaxis protein
VISPLLLNRESHYQIFKLPNHLIEIFWYSNCLCDAHKLNRHTFNQNQTSFMGTTKSKKVLIVEDEGDICLLINILLSGNGIELDHVQTLAKAEEYLQQSQPSVVILDNKLPDGFGVDMIPFLKQAHPSIKIIMISGFDKAAEDVALENGADIYLAKPFTQQQLFGAVESLVN